MLVCNHRVRVRERERERESVKSPHLSAPLRVDRVAADGRAFVLAMVRQGGEGAVLPGLNRELQVRVGVEEHPLLQPQGLDVWQQGPGI